MSDKKNILILGANSDVAKELAILYISDNNFVMMASRNITAMEDFILSKTGNKDSAHYCYFDALDTDSHYSFYSQLPQKPHIVIYAAGFLVQNEDAFADFHAFEKMSKTNYTSAVSILNIVIQDNNANLEKIIGLSSLSGTRGRKSNFIYGSTKAAFEHYLEGLRQYLSPRKIGVHVFVLGYIDTKINKSLHLNRNLIMKPKYVAKRIKKVGNNFRTVPNWKWKIIFTIIRLLPERLLAKLP